MGINTITTYTTIQQKFGLNPYGFNKKNIYATVII